MTAARRLVERLVSAAAASGDFLGGGGEAWVEVAAYEDVDDVEGCEEEARDDAGHEQIADADLGRQAVDDHDDAGRNQGGEGARRADGADAELLVVAEAEHLGEGDQAEHDDLAAHDAGHSGHDHGDDDGLHSDAASEVAGEDRHGVEQVLGDAGLFQDRGHQHEEGDRH